MTLGNSSGDRSEECHGPRLLRAQKPVEFRILTVVVRSPSIPWAREPASQGSPGMATVAAAALTFLIWTLISPVPAFPDASGSFPTAPWVFAVDPSGTLLRCTEGLPRKSLPAVRLRIWLPKANDEPASAAFS